MAEAATSIKTAQQFFNEVLIKGRIEAMEQANGFYFTIVQSPAPDEWSSPSRFKVKSASPIGSLGEIRDIKCRLSGSVRAKNYIDKATGQSKIFQDASAYLELIG